MLHILNVFLFGSFCCFLGLGERKLLTVTCCWICKVTPTFVQKQNQKMLLEKIYAVVYPECFCNSGGSWTNTLNIVFSEMHKPFSFLL